MNRTSLVRALGLVLAGAGAVAIPMTFLNAQPAPQATVAQAAPSQPIVTGLPDFTQLVRVVSPGVVNIEARSKPRSVERGQMPPDMQGMPEIFRRFFGEDGPGGGGGLSPGGTALGSGFLISSDGEVLTNHHVVDGADSVKVTLEDGRSFEAKVVGSDARSDVALLKINAQGLPALRLGQSSRLAPGQWVVAIGSPFGLDHSVSAGIVSALGRTTSPEQQYVPFIQTDVAINRGNSGGPLLDTSGGVVGINSQIFSNSGGYEGVSFAIPIDTAMSVARQLKATGTVRYGMLGVTMQPLDADQARTLGLPDTRGALINQVQPGSAAQKAGIQAMDVIRAFNGERIRDQTELAPRVGALPPGTRVVVTVWRDGHERDMPVVLGALDADAAQAARPGTAPAGKATAAAGPLGVRLAELDGDDRRRLGLAAGEGVGVADVTADAAREAGLRRGDVILRVGRTAVGSAAQVNQAIAGAAPGERVMLLVRRGESQAFVTVPIGK